MRQLLVLFMAGLAIWAGCREGNEADANATQSRPPLSDTLVAVFEDVVAAATNGRPDDFRELLSSSEVERLSRVRRGYGAMSLGWCLERQLGSWPNMDTLAFEDLVHNPPYARVSFSGAAPLARYSDRVKYTFLLFRRSEMGWRLAGVTSLEKDRYDHYGTRLTYLETELPSQLRFPRLF